MNQTELEERLRAMGTGGDVSGTATLGIQGYGSEVFGFLLNMLNDRTDAEEVFQQACVDLWLGLGAFRWQSSFRTWAYSVAHNAGLRHRKNQRRCMVQLSDCPELEQAARTATAPFAKTEVKAAIHRLRERLDTEERALLVLRIDRNMSWSEVATAVTSPDACLDERARAQAAQSVRQRFHRLKAKLKEMAEAEGLLEPLG
jgi:RNA polymerase sigma-70 factor (ECF subfamily)